MRRLAVLALAVAGLVLPAAALGNPHDLKLDKADISDKQCNGPRVVQVVDVHFRILNDADSGFNSGQAWANDTFDRHLRIWHELDGSYCALVEDHGKFVTYAGKSPGATNSTIAAGITGDIEGGYVTDQIVGTFAPTLPTHGDLGTFDDQCDVNFNCAGSHPSWASYFNPLTSAASFAQWGWIYHAGKHGTWLNQDDVSAADSGDIT
jgi:hypothetical protein